MKIFVALWHPSHVHTFKNVIKNLGEKGHEIKVVAIKKDITLELLDLYNIDYDVIGESKTNDLKDLLSNYLEMTYRLWKILKNFDSDLYLGRASLQLSHISLLLDVPYVAFYDSDIKSITDNFSYYDCVFTPQNFSKEVNTDFQKALPTYKELAYLHPNNFSPDKSSLTDIGLDPNEKFSLVRFSGYEAWHDVGQYGFNYSLKVKLVKTLEKYGKVYLSSENELPKDLKEYQVNVPYDKIHDVLYYATLFVGDSQTMTTEAAVLGTPAVRCSSFAGDNDMSNFIELEKKYGLIFNYRDPEKAIRKSEELIKDPQLKEKWAEKRKNLLNDKIDLSSFLIWFIDNYPESVKLLKKDKDYYLKVVE